MRFAALLASFLAASASALAVVQPQLTIPNGRASNHRYAAKGATGALKIRRAAAKARNVQRHKRNCRA